MTRRRARGAFSLIELLAVVAVIGVLAALVFPALSGGGAAAGRAKCAATMKQLATAALVTAAETGSFPRSSHSAYAHKERAWSRAILAAMGEDPDMPAARFAAAQARLFRCPADKKRKTGQSYGLNVFFELDPDFDEYEGSPARWRQPASLPHPSRTILIAETGGSSDHVMAHFWTPGAAGGYDCAHDRHQGRANYAFADGHVELLPLGAVYNPAAGTNLWNPSLAR